MSTETAQAAAKCVEPCVYAVHMRGGAPISVRICMLCGQIDFDDLTAQAQAYAAPLSALPDELQGDGPCKDCGTAHNVCWFTDNVLWNQVMSYPDAPSFDDPGGIVVTGEWICPFRVTTPEGELVHGGRWPDGRVFVWPAERAEAEAWLDVKEFHADAEAREWHIDWAPTSEEETP